MRSENEKQEKIARRMKVHEKTISIWCALGVSFIGHCENETRWRGECARAVTLGEKSRQAFGSVEKR